MTDRIKQMAEEADYHADALDGSGELQRTNRTWSEVREQYFAALVAEDCLSDDDALSELMASHLYGHTRDEAIEFAKEDKFDSQKHKASELLDILRLAIRARYGIKGE